MAELTQSSPLQEVKGVGNKLKLHSKVIILHVYHVQRLVMEPKKQFVVEQKPAFWSPARQAIQANQQTILSLWSITHQSAGWTCCHMTAAAPPWTKGGAVKQGPTIAWALRGYLGRLYSGRM